MDATIHGAKRRTWWARRRRARFGAHTGLLGLLATCAVAGVAFPGVDGSFSSRTGDSSSWQVATVPAPTGLSVSRTCSGGAAPTFKGMATAASGTSVTSVTVNTPPAAAGDFLLAFVTASATNAATSPGWINANGAGGPGVNVTALYLQLTAAPASTYTFTWPDGNSGTVVLLSYSGVGADGFYIPWMSSTSGSSATTATSSTVTPPRAPGRMVVALVVNQVPAVSTPGGLTKRTDVIMANNLSGTTVFDGEITGTGTTPAYTSTWSGAQNWLMLPVYLMGPASSSSTVTLSWTAAAGAEGYAIRRSDGPTFSIGSGSTVSLTDNSTVATTAYSYYVSTKVGAWTSAEASASLNGCT